MKSALVGAFALAAALTASSAFATTVTSTSGILPPSRIRQQVQ
jgi:hypothetical protein